MINLAKIRLVLAIFAFCTASQTLSAQMKTIGKIIVHDDRLSNLLADDAKIEVLAEGFTWTEGPVWVPESDDGPSHLLFSDIPRNSIFKWQEDRGISLFMQPSGYTGTAYYGLEPGSNGLALDLDGNLLLCEHGDRRVSVLLPNGGKRTLADNYNGRLLNSPNDLAVHSSGNIYFTDPPYGLPQRENDSRRELAHFGVYRIERESKKVELLTDELTRPNGIAFSPDEDYLYVSQSDPEAAIWMKYPIHQDGTLQTGTVFFDATNMVDEKPGLPDGMTVDKDGTVWATGPGGVWVFSSDGDILGLLETGQRTSNCTIVSELDKYLYITADSYLCRVQLKK